VISTFVFAGMIPSTLLAVDGSARTLIWVDVIPSTACTAVGCAGSGVSVGEGLGVSGTVTGSVEVMIKGVGVNVVSSLNLELQPVYKRIKTVKITLENRMDTVRFYRLSHACGTCVSELFIWTFMLKFDCEVKQIMRYSVIENKFDPANIYTFTLQGPNRSAHLRTHRPALTYSNPRLAPI
jgi:hypothetical protein